MIFKTLALGAAVGLLLALPSCSPAPCGPGNCQGCCDLSIGKCRSPGNTTRTCGVNGLACMACAPGESCSEGLCVVPGVGGGGGTSAGGGAGGGGGGGGGGSATGGGAADAGPPPGCGPGTSTPCLTGCCNGTGSTAACLAGTAASACGKGASACTACNFASGQRCVDQACFGANDAGPDLFGTPCGADADCSALGGNFKCKLATSSDNVSYPGGYCTRSCLGSADCPTRYSICVDVNPIYGEADDFCWDRCSATDLCRSPGYRCYTLNNGSACWLSPLPTLDAGPRSDKTGLPCTDRSACINPPDDGFCRPEFLSDGGPTGMIGGSCSSFCRIDKNHCGDGGVCVNYGCEQACSAPFQGEGQCRPGYVCGPIFLADGGSSATGRCRPNCNNPGASCGAGRGCTPNPVAVDDAGTDDAGTDDAGTDDAGTDDAGTDDAGVAIAGYCCDSQRCY